MSCSWPCSKDRLPWAQPLKVSVKAWQIPGSRMFIEPSKPVSVDELLRGMIVQSGNDATVALAEGVAGSEEAFVQKMNEQATRLGLVNTRFANATGLADPAALFHRRRSGAAGIRGDPRLSRIFSALFLA